MTLFHIEAEPKRVFHLRKVIFLSENTGSDSHPVLESPKWVHGEVHFNLGVWHVDEMVAWANPTTVILPLVPAAELTSGNPFTLATHQALEDAYQVLSPAPDQDGPLPWVAAACIALPSRFPRLARRISSGAREQMRVRLWQWGDKRFFPCG